MRLSSKGLGRLVLPFDLAEAAVERGADDRLWLRGRIKERNVRWDYRMRLDEPDIVRFIALARDPRIVRYVAERVGPRLLGRVLRRAASTALVLVGVRRGAAAGE